MNFPRPFSTTDSADHHSTFDQASLSVRAVEKDEPRHLDFHRHFENALVTAATILFDEIEDMLSRFAVFLSRRDFDDHMP